MKKLFSLTFASIIVTQYLSGVFGVIVEPTPLYRDAGLHYAKVRDEAVLGGRKVKVVELANEGRWLRIVTDDGIMGYVPEDAIRLI